jgi:hypothetical protein
MVRCLAESAAVEPSTGGPRHDAIVARFEGFLEANSDRPLYLPEIAPPSASRSEGFAPPVKSIWEWDQSGISPCAECTSCGGRSCAQTPPRQPSLALSPTMASGSLDAFRLPTVRYSENLPRSRCDALWSNRINRPSSLAVTEVTARVN